MSDPYLPQEAVVIERIQESPTITTLRLKFMDHKYHDHFQFTPGQFNMLYLYGVGEVAISISSDPEDRTAINHTIRALGRVTKALVQLKEGDSVGVRGPFGRGWPLALATNKEVLIITGGLGCAPAVSVIHYMMERRRQYGAIKILQGLKHSEDFIFRKQYAKWQQLPNTEVYIAADVASSHWPWLTGRVTNMIQNLQINSEISVAMLCGPEIMMYVSAHELIKKGLLEDNIYLSMERNMECAIGHCGHCQFGGLFICKDGPIFPYAEIKALLNKPGF
jgi:NAD(P)H-flavin reductase